MRPTVRRDACEIKSKFTSIFFFFTERLSLTAYVYNIADYDLKTKWYKCNSYLYNCIIHVCTRYKNDTTIVFWKIFCKNSISLQTFRANDLTKTIDINNINL